MEIVQKGDDSGGYCVCFADFTW